MIGATLPRPRLLHRFRSEPQQISVSARSRTCRKLFRHPSAPVVFTLEAAHSIFQPASSPAAFGTVSRKNPFNTQRLVPAPFNEFYPKCSGPTIPLHHAILPPEHFR